MKNVWTTILISGLVSLWGMGCETGEYLESGEETPYATTQTGCLPSKQMSWTYRAGDSLPLGQSRPGANVTLFLDFDGGSFSGVSSGKVSSSYDSSKRAAIEKTVEQMAGNYSRWNINVTTDKKVFDSAKKRARIFVTTSKGSSGMASTNGISSSSGYTGYVGVDAVLRPGSAEKCAYVPTHEFGHNFKLRGTDVDYADLYPNATIGAFMGGRDSQFKGYEWIALDSKEGWQDPVKIIGAIAGFVSDGSGDVGGSCHTVPLHHSDYCTSSCPCNEGEGDCDRDSQCASGLVCEERGNVDVCVKPAGGSSGGGSCNLPVVNSGNGGTGYGECQGDCDRDSDCKSGLVCVQLNTGDSVPGCIGRSSNNYDYCVKPMCLTASEPDETPDETPDEPSGGAGKITHIGTKSVWDGDGQNIKIARPSGSNAGDLLVLILHRTDDDLPLYVKGWTRVAECYKRDNGYACSTEANCKSWHNDDFCGDFGGHGGHDLAQSIFYRKVSSSEPTSYTFNLNRDSSGHPGWIILSALRGAATSNPVRDWAHMGCDGSSRSVFPSVNGVAGDMVLLSQSYDDKIAQSKFGAPKGTTTFGYVSNSDEAGFLFGGTLSKTGQTGKMTTTGDGASSCKDALVSLTIKPQ